MHAAAYFLIVLLGSSSMRAQDPALENVTPAQGDETATFRSLSEGDPPQLGSLAAPIVIVEFADFECPYCKDMNDVLENQLLPAEHDKVRIIYRYLPLTRHPWSRSAAELAACAKAQANGFFWKLNDFLYANQARLSVQSLQQEATQALNSQPSFDAAAFKNCIDRKSVV